MKKREDGGQKKEERSLESLMWFGWALTRSGRLTSKEMSWLIAKTTKSIASPQLSTCSPSSPSFPAVHRFPSIPPSLSRPSALLIVRNPLGSLSSVPFPPAVALPCRPPVSPQFLVGASIPKASEPLASCAIPLLDAFSDRAPFRLDRSLFTHPPECLRVVTTSVPAGGEDEKRKARTKAR